MAEHFEPGQWQRGVATPAVHTGAPGQRGSPRRWVAGLVLLAVLAAACGAEEPLPAPSGEPDAPVESDQQVAKPSDDTSAPTTTASTDGPDAAPQPSEAESENPEASPEPAPTAPPVLDAISLLDALAVVEEHDLEYDRSHFKHWTDADKDGCKANREVLIEEAVEPPTRGDECKLVGGLWISRYDGLINDDGGRANKDADIPGFDIDHMVPLKEAWQSGAHAWTPLRRELYANDLGYSESLIAVSASSNRSKSDRDPADWMPPDDGQWCWYATAWVAVKTRWGLSVDPVEADELRSVLEGCPELPVEPPPPAPPTDEPSDEVPTTNQTTVEPAHRDAELQGCSPHYEPCLPDMPGDALDCGDLAAGQKPVTVLVPGVDPYRLDRDGDGSACTS